MEELEGAWCKTRSLSMEMARKIAPVFGEGVISPLYRLDRPSDADSRLHSPHVFIISARRVY